MELDEAAKHAENVRKRSHEKGGKAVDISTEEENGLDELVKRAKDGRFEKERK